MIDLGLFTEGKNERLKVMIPDNFLAFQNVFLEALKAISGKFRAS